MARRVVGGPGWLRVGGEAELRSDEPGYQGAWFAVEIVNVFPTTNQAGVQYRDFVVSEVPGSARIREFTKVDNLRPPPPAQPPRREPWRPRDAVEALHNDAWWVGYIKHPGARPASFRVYFGRDQAELDIPLAHLRPRLNYVRPSRECPNGSWSLARPMQDPAVWERREEATPLPKRPAVKRPVTPRATTPPSDDSWDAHEERRRRPKKKARASAPAPAKASGEKKKVIRIMAFPQQSSVTLMRAIPSIHPPASLGQQSTLVLTPGSSPPLADSPFHDSPGSDSPKATRSSSSNSSSSSGTANSTSSSATSDEDEDENGSARGPIFHDFAADLRASRNLLAYKQVLECFHGDDKGYIDEARKEVLRGIMTELKLTADQCNQLHCVVFGLPGAYW